MRIHIDNNAIAEIEHPGAAASLNAACPRSLNVGDRILAVDDFPLPLMDSTANMESWFRGKLGSSNTLRDVRLTVLRPVEWAAGVAMLPRCTTTAGVIEEDGQSAGTSSTAVSRCVSDLVSDLAQCPDAAGKALPTVKELTPEAFEEDLRRRGPALVPQ
jgi:hypothetical protein